MILEIFQQSSKKLITVESISEQPQKARLAYKLVDVFCPVLTSLLEFPPFLPEFLLEVWVRPSLVIEIDAVADDGSRYQAHR